MPDDVVARARAAIQRLDRLQIRVDGPLASPLAVLVGTTVELADELERTRAALDGYRREHYERHMAEHRDARDSIRCLTCSWRYGARDHACSCDYGLRSTKDCPPGQHTYDPDELAAAMVCDDPIHSYKPDLTTTEE